jgi:transcriptional regulator with XRE-family HTH domain
MPGPREPSQQQRAQAFGDQLRRLRRTAKLTQREVAQRVPMSPGNLSRIENAEQGPPSDEVIVRLAAALDVDVDTLMGLAGRRLSIEGFEELVLTELKQMHAEISAGFARIEATLTKRE